jgi:hypothetical protein
MLTGCRYSALEYTPQPQVITSQEQAKTIMSKILSEQPRRNGVQQLTVYDDRITFSEDRNNLISLGAMNSSMAIYYTTVDQMKLYMHNRSETYNIDLYRHKTKVYAVRCFAEADAKRFMDAFRFMQELNMKK